MEKPRNHPAEAVTAAEMEVTTNDQPMSRETAMKHTIMTTNTVVLVNKLSQASPNKLTNITKTIIPEEELIQQLKTRAKILRKITIPREEISLSLIRTTLNLLKTRISEKQVRDKYKRETHLFNNYFMMSIQILRLANLGTSIQIKAWSY
jgi:hypothetical protein